ncbi:hypothetical protein Y032_0108g42 [Ancylostoma ceylanicum]|uniref:Uncharacterized protein n=1 Tax=Ancylostoma ceylanicum TaxID=53326 RepID=A0A016TFD1_9BILA|nr:hypothetical protein Y032_0108g42 [Ancylostoma ceylanicum]
MKRQSTTRHPPAIFVLTQGGVGHSPSARPHPLSSASSPHNMRAAALVAIAAAIANLLDIVDLEEDY